MYRFNGAFQEAKSFRDNVNNNAFLISPSITYVPNEKTSVNVELIINNMHGNLDRGQPIFGAVAGKTNLNSTPKSLNMGAPDDYFKTKDLIIMGSFAHHFNQKISFNGSYMKQVWQENIREHRTNYAFVPDLSNTPVSSLAMMQFLQRKQKWSVDNLSAYFNFKYNSGEIEHQTLVGYDLHAWEKRDGGYQNAARGFLLKDGSVAASYNPANAANYETMEYQGMILPKPNVSPFDLTPGAHNYQGTDYHVLNIQSALPTALTTTNAVYAQHLLTWRKFKVLAGLRQEWFQDITHYKKDDENSFRNAKMLYRVGVTYSLNSHINFYGTYLTGYQPQSNTVTLMPNTGSFTGSQSAAKFKPLISDLKEVGMKANLFGKSMLSVALYEINQKNVLINANNPAEPDELTQRGADRSRGLEVEFSGFITPQWSVYGGYTYIDAKIIRNANPALEGLRKENTPKNSANIWTRYNFANTTALKNFGIGMGMLYQSSRIPWFTRDFVVPAYTTLDAALYYTMYHSKVQLSANINNITNTNYWLGAQSYLRMFPGAPRNFMVAATYKF